MLFLTFVRALLILVSEGMFVRYIRQVIYDSFMITDNPAVYN